MFDNQNTLHFKSDNYWIPIGLCEKVVIENLTREFQVWIVMKHLSNGSRLQNSKGLIEDISRILGVSTRTTKRAITRVVDMNWIGYNKVKQHYYPRAVEGIRIIEKLESRIAYTLDIKDIKEARYWCFAAMLSNLIFHQKKKLEGEKIRERSRHRSRHFKLPSYYPISLLSIQKIYGIKRSTASQLRIEANRAGFIKMKPVFKVCMQNEQKLKFSPEYKKHSEVRFKHKLVNWKGYLAIQMPNEIKTNLSRGKRPTLSI